MCEVITKPIMRVMGGQDDLNAIYTSDKQIPAPQNYLKTSLCWTCARARALPDPDGCAFHRREHKHVYDRAEYLYNKDNDRVVSVTDCKHHVFTGPGLYSEEKYSSSRGNNRRKAELNRREVVRMWQEGTTQSSIAEIIGVHVHTVAKYIKEHQRRARA